MANSRLERLGTIYSRVTGLLRAGAVKVEDKPVWYDIYTAFPPEFEPSYSYKPPAPPIKPILYTEDVLRSKFQKTNADLTGIINLEDSKPTACQEFISIYKKVVEEKPDENVFEEALDILKTGRYQIGNASKTSAISSLASAFSEAKEETKS